MYVDVGKGVGGKLINSLLVTQYLGAQDTFPYYSQRSLLAYIRAVDPSTIHTWDFVWRDHRQAELSYGFYI